MTLVSPHPDPMALLYECAACDTEWTSTDRACWCCGRPGSVPEQGKRRIYWSNAFQPLTPATPVDLTH